MLVWSCNSKKQSSYKQISFPLWGTQCDITYKHKEGVNVENDIKQLLDALTDDISTYDSNTVLSRINSNKSVQISQSIFELLELSRNIHLMTNGLFDPTVQPLVKEWGFLMQQGKWIDTMKLPEILVSVGLYKWEWNDTVILKKPIDGAIDFNAIAPGYAADKIAAYFKKKGIHNFYINNGGEIMLSGSRPDGNLWQIGITSPGPTTKDKMFDTLYKITDIGLATSGNYINNFEYKGKKYGHTISAKTGMPIESNLLSATVFSINGAAIADAFATACMAITVDDAVILLRENRLKGYFIYRTKNNQLERKVVD